MSYNNGGGDDGTMIIMVVMISLVCCCCCVCGLSILTAYANDGCDTSGTFSFLVGQWYQDLMQGQKLFTDCGTAPPADTTTGDTSGGNNAAAAGTPGSDGSGDGGKAGANNKLPDGKKCNPGTIANYDYDTRKWDEKKNAWSCASGWSTTWCGVATDASGNWVDGENNERQCRKRKSGSGGSSNNGTSNTNCITIFSDYSYDKTRRPKGEHTLCMESGKSEMKIPNLKNVKSDGYDWNDRISHVSVPKGITLSLWDNENWTGKQTEDIVGPVNKKSLGEINYKKGQRGNINVEATTLHFWKNNDAPSSSASSGGNASSSSKGGCNYKSSSDKVWVFEKDKYKGNCQSFGNGNHNLALNSVGSLKIPKNSKRRVKLCQEYNQGGSCKYFVKDTSKMFSSHKNAKSVKVYK